MFSIQDLQKKLLSNETSSKSLIEASLTQIEKTKRNISKNRWNYKLNYY